jgi:HAD superfamily hydrolase (TIGR01484 family)
MRYHVLAVDYDGTLAQGGRVADETIEALERLRQTGRRLVMVTGRQLEHLLEIFPRPDLFDRLVVENGAVLYRPASREERLLCEPPPTGFVEELQRRGVSRLSAGRVIVATWVPNEIAVLDVIRDLGLELHVIFNKGAVMVLPSGVNKATGLAEALTELGCSAHNAVGIGDAENDHAFLRSCECAVAVANALPATQQEADTITPPNGAGVRELVTRLLESDLLELETNLVRRRIDLGFTSEGEPVRLDPYRDCILLAGTSGGGKSTIATGIIERLAEQKYQYCVIDPEGDYTSLENTAVLGTAERAPSEDEVLSILEAVDRNVVVNLLGIRLADRPSLFSSLFLRLRELRGRTGRPHWHIVDETHHLMPAERDDLPDLSGDLHGMLFITVHPERVSRLVLSSVSSVIAIGANPDDTLAEFAQAAGLPAPARGGFTLEPGEGVLWRCKTGDPPIWFRSIPPRGERRRHVRKYAHGELAPERSFYFRGPDGALHLRAQNLELFLQIGDGVDEPTWMYHLSEGDYSQWFRERIKDEETAAEVRQVELEPGITAEESRRRIREIVERRYTAPE